METKTKTNNTELNELNTDKIDLMCNEVFNTLNKFEATENEALNTMANCLLQVIKRYESQVDAYKAADIVHKSVMINIPKMYETDGNG